MNNRKDFLKWLEINKKLPKIEIKSKMWKYDSINRAHRIFEISDISIIKQLNKDGALDVYMEYLETIKKENAEKTETLSKNTVSLSEKSTKAEKMDEPELNKDIHSEKTNKKENAKLSTTEFEKKREMLEGSESLKKKNATQIKENDFEYLEKKVISFVKCAADKYNLSRKKTDSNENSSVFIFDIVTGRYSDVNNNKQMVPMCSYVWYDGKRFKRKDNVFYYQQECHVQGSCVNNFSKNLKLHDIGIIADTIKSEMESGQSLSLDNKSICLVPDSLGDFKDGIKAELQGLDRRILQIPRSIAAMYYAVDIGKVKENSQYTIYDFETEQPCKIDIRIDYDSELDEFVILRMGRKKLSSKEWTGFSDIARQYIELYVKNHSLNITESVVNAMIQTRDVLKVIHDKTSIMYENNGKFFSIDYDESIVSTLKKTVFDLISNDSLKQENVIVILSLGSKNSEFISLANMESGCLEILRRNKNKQIIWKEYLPELSLEVIRDGTFNSLQLISKNSMQNITESSMDEEVDIPIENGRFIFMPGREKIYCPLTREEFGNIQRDKMAMFYAPKIFPLKEAVEVELSLKYRYGDPDSYRLIATPINGEFKELSSQWCDESDQIMGNDRIPEYTPQRLWDIDIDVDEIIEEALSKTESGWFYSSTAHNSNPPFDKSNNWFALNSISYNLIAIRNLFSMHSVDEINDYTLNNIRTLLEKLNELYNDANIGYLYGGDCDFSNFHIRCIKHNILNITSMLGMFLVNEIGLDYNTRCSIVNNIFESNEYRYILQLSTYVSRDNDEFRVWDQVYNLLSKLKGKDMLDAIRTIGTVCWRSEEWIYEFSAINKSIIQSIIDTSFAYCHSEIDKISDGYNPRTIRDILEALLGITRLKKENSMVYEIMNCNSKKVKDFIVDLKKTNELMLTRRLKFPFVSRIEMDVPDNMKNVSSVVYPLIEILSDGNAVKLTGFTED